MRAAVATDNSEVAGGEKWQQAYTGETVNEHWDPWSTLLDQFVYLFWHHS